MKSNNDAASVKCCARKIWAHFKEFIVSAKGDLKETHDEMFQGADTPKQRLQRSVKHGLLLLAQLCLIMGVYAAGCALASVLPITLPGNILGMVLLLVLLGTHILKTKYISEACDYLIDNMSVFFIPAGVAIMGSCPGSWRSWARTPRWPPLLRRKTRRKPRQAAPIPTARMPRAPTSIIRIRPAAPSAPLPARRLNPC